MNRMTPYKSKIFALSCFTVTACGSDKGSKEKTDPANPAHFLTAAHVAKPATLDAVTQDDLKDTLADDPSIWLNAPSDTSSSGLPEKTEGVDNDCLYNQIKIYGQKNILAVHADIQAKDCLDIQKLVKGRTDVSAPTLNIKSFRIRQDTWMKCSADVDLSALDGKKAKDIFASEQNLADCKANYDMWSEMLVEIDVSYSFTTEGNAVSGSVKMDMVQADFKDTVETPCTFTVNAEKTIETSNGCSHVETTSSTFSPTGGEAKKSGSYTKSTSENLTGPVASKDPWYSGGAIKYLVGGWEGTLTYTDAKTAPTYSLKSGDITSTGNLNSATPASLVDTQIGTVLRNFLATQSVSLGALRTAINTASSSYSDFKNN